MGYLPKKDALDGIKARTRVRNGIEYTVYDAYIGYDPYDGKQRRYQNSDLAKLKADVEAFYATHRTGGEAAVRLKGFEAQDARDAIDLLRQNGRRISLLEVVQEWLGGDGAVTDGGKTLGEAYDLFLKSLVGKSKAYLKALRSRVGGFVSEIGADVALSSLTAQKIVGNIKGRVLDAKNEKTWKTFNNHLGDVKTFLSWCAKSEQGFIRASPVEDAKKIVLHYHDPEYVRAEDIGRLFAVLVRHADTNPADLADAILSFFCGMRQCEIEYAREGETATKFVLDAERPYMRVIKQKGSTSGKKPRTFEIPEQALAWMRSFDFLGAVAKKNAKFRRHLVERAREAGVALPKNAGRHTFITMYAAAYHDQAKLTGIVGNTEGVRAKAYDGVEVEANGLAYFGILPPA